MVIPQRLRIFVEMGKCLNDLSTVIVVFVRGCIEGSLDLDLPVTPGLKSGSYLKLFNVAIFKVVISTPLTGPIILIRVLINSFPRAGSSESSNPVGKDSKLFSG